MSGAGHGLAAVELMLFVTKPWPAQVANDNGVRIVRVQ